MLNATGTVTREERERRERWEREASPPPTNLLQVLQNIRQGGGT
jgi:hypothetical protein